MAIKAFGQVHVLWGIFWSVAAISCFGFALYGAREAIREIKTAMGTNFKGANLNGVDFGHAILDNCKFNQASTRLVNWSYARGEHYTIDFTDTQMQLMMSRDGTNGMYPDLDLSAHHLAGVELIKANLSGTDLTRSNLQGADLTFANLTNVKAGGTDFRRATLTGACIQNWTINRDTQFDDLICDYIYLTPDRHPQNRRPLAGSFEPGDFEQLVDKFADTLDFILRRGTDPLAFTQALNQFKQDNPEARIQAILNLDGERALVRATVPPDADKVKIYEDFQANQRQLQAANERIRYLEGKTEADRENRDFIGQLLTAMKPELNVIQAHQMTDQRNQYKASGDINVAQGKSAINTGTGVAAGGDISGTLTLNLAALRDAEDPKTTELADLLTQLRAAIEAPTCDLDDRYKTRALEYLDNLATLAKNPPASDSPTDLLKTAKDNLDDLADIADKGSKLANFAKDHLPTFTAALTALRLWFGL